MPDGRQHARKALHPPVSFKRANGEPVVAHCENVSLGGMYITTAFPLPDFGEKITLIIEFPGDAKPSEVEAIVRWTKPAGMGLQFGAMGARETHALTKLLASLSMPPPG